MVVMIVLSSTLDASTWYVDATNCPGPGDGSLSNPFCAIQAGIHLASDGDTVLVMPGNYVENVRITGKSLTLISSAGAAVTIMDGSTPAVPNLGSVLSIIGTKTSGTVVEGFTLRNRSGTHDSTTGDQLGGGAYLSQTDCMIRGCVVANNLLAPSEGADASGAGICSVGGSPSILECEIFQNRISLGSTGSASGAGIHCENAVAPSITGNQIHENVIQDFSNINSVYGGGICLRDSGGTISQNTIRRNGIPFISYGRNSMDGRIFCMDSSPHSPSIRGNLIEENYSGRHGGGISCDDQSPALIEDNDILRNSAVEGGAGGVWGGSNFLEMGATIRSNRISENIAAFVSGGVWAGLRVEDNLISGNRAGWDGGGVAGCRAVLRNTICFNVAGPSAAYPTTCEGSGIPTTQQWGEYRENCIYGNLAENGGGIACPDNAYLAQFITDNTIHDNAATRAGGGLYISYKSPTIDRNRLYDNRGEIHGGGMFLNASQPRIVNNIVHGNTALQHGGAVYSLNASPIVVNCTFTQNTAHQTAGGIFVSSVYHPEVLVIANTILWQNVALQGGSAAGPELVVTTQAILQIASSDLSGGQASCYVDATSTLLWGAGMIDADPRFSNPTLDDFHLTPLLPCLDAGEDALVPTGSSIDIDHDPRFFRWMLHPPHTSIVDIGADELFPLRPALGQ